MNKEDNIDFVKKSLRIQRQRIEDQIKKLQDDVLAIKRAEDILSDQPVQSTLFDKKLQIEESNRFVNSTPTQAILKILQDRPDKSFEPPTITEELTKGGLKTKADNLNSIVYPTLIRLVKEGKVERQQLSGKRKSVFRIKHGEQ